ncbi:hypothetical protein CARUB_v10020903mg [Capsella rubella]|uniref:MADS-box domain-containing protein n=1 Tax=Capsella rubella TaxID=81985 RepID=R0GIG3_9BRAS|nr:MADS-box transcription factor PHERES 2 [Capsella rubella]EOA35682.1 hypothetical protein CARUB_v10020903mg [Capsella rubella]
MSELSTLCGIKTCGVIYSPYNPEPEAWPSREGAERVISEFLEVPIEKRRMVTQEALLCERIAREQRQLQKLRTENRDSEMQNIMFGFLRREIDVPNLGELNIPDLISFIDKYINKLTCRAKQLRENGESSSSLPLSRPPVAPNSVVIPVEDNDHKNHNQQNLIQRQNDFRQVPQKIHKFNMNMNVNLDLSLNLNSNSNRRMILDLNQIPNAEEHEDIPSMEGSNPPT